MRKLADSINWTTVLVALLGALAAGVPATITAWHTSNKVDAVSVKVEAVDTKVVEVRKATDGLLKKEKAESKAQGVAVGKVQGKAQEKQRQSELPLFQRGK